MSFKIAIVKNMDDTCVFPWHNIRMAKKDLRKMGNEDRADLIRTVLEKLGLEKNISKVAREEGIHRQLIYKWKRELARGSGHKKQVRGRHPFRLYPSQEKKFLQFLYEMTPQDIGITESAWNRINTNALVSQLFGLSLTPYGMRILLKGWGFYKTQKAKSAFLKCYPQTHNISAIAYAQEYSYRCFYIDVLKIHRKDFSYAFLIAVSPRGDVRFMSLKSGADQSVAIRLISKLYLRGKNKLLLIVNHSVTDCLLYHSKLPARTIVIQ
jgi:transposase-like protein